ncbi:MAG: hypothetical protein ACK5D5_03075 [Bacteroidota bacterium]
MKKLILISTFALALSLLHSQDKNSYRWFMSEGKLLYLEETYVQALKQFLNAYQIDSTGSNLNYMIGCCYLKHPTSKHLAINYLERSIKDIDLNYNDEDPMEKSAPTMAYFYLAQAYHLCYKFEDALKMYEKYTSFINPKKYKEEIDLVNFHKKMTYTAIEKCSKPFKVEIVNLGDSINSDGFELSPLLSPDEKMLLFTYAGNRTTGAAENYKTINDQYFEDVFVSYLKEDSTWTNSKSISQNINSNFHDGLVALSNDGKTMVIYRDDKGDGNLLYSNWDGTDWSVPVAFGNEINSKKWETSACFSPDGNTLYFVSNKPGGFGGKDIYRSRKINDRWGMAENLGPSINTKYDEESPWIHPNGEDFFFSSIGHNSMGGFDVCLSKLDSAGKFGAIETLPYPINTTDDDDFYMVSVDGKRAYYSSSHEDLKGYGEQDIYMVKLGNLLDRDKHMVLFTGKFDTDSLPPGISVNVYDMETNKLIGIYLPQENGNFSVILDPNKKYIFSYLYNNKEFLREEVPANDELTYDNIHREISLKNIGIADSIIGRKIYMYVNVFNNKKDKKPIKNAKLTLKNKNGKITEYIANDKGVVSGINLSLNNEYIITASKGNTVSREKKINTNNVKANSMIKESIYLQGDKDDIVVKNNDTYNVKDSIKGVFTHYFEYNRVAANANPNYTRFMKELTERVKENPELEIKINSSASRVPTRLAGGNIKLARMRADNMKYLIVYQLNKKGVNTAKIKFKISSVVSGPKYKNDSVKRRRVFEKYQYVKVSY